MKMQNSLWLFPILLFAQSCRSPRSAAATESNSVAISTESAKQEIEVEKSLNDLSQIGKRYKNCEKGKVLKKPGTFNLTVDGINVMVKNQKVVGVGKLNLKQDVLNAITEKFAIIDDLIYSNCVDLSREYSTKMPDKSIIIRLLDQKEKLITVLANISSQIRQAENNEKNEDELKKAIDSTSVSFNIHKAATLFAPNMAGFR